MFDYPLEVLHSEILLNVYTQTVTITIGVNFIALLLMSYVIIFTEKL